MRRQSFSNEVNHNQFIETRARERESKTYILSEVSQYFVGEQTPVTQQAYSKLSEQMDKYVKKSDKHDIEKQNEGGE